MGASAGRPRAGRRAYGEEEGGNMTLSKRQRVVIWSFVIVTVILLGLGDCYNFEGTDRSGVEFYGMTFNGHGGFAYEVIARVAGQKYLLIGVFALIGATLIITSKKK